MTAAPPSQSIPLLSGARPLLGHAREFAADTLGLFARAGREGDGFARLNYYGRALHIGVTHAVAHELLVEKVKHIEKAPGLRLVLEPLAGNGLFTSEGELWRRQRRLMAPLFQPAVLTRYIDAMVSCAEAHAERFSDGQPVELNREMTRVTMNVVGKTLFGADTLDEADALGDALTTALHWSDRAIRSPRAVLQLLTRMELERAAPRLPPALQSPARRALETLRRPVLLPGYYGRQLRSAISTLDARMQQLIDDRRAAPEGAHNDLLEALLRARDAESEGGPAAMSDRQLRDEACTLFVAGHETTATALAWAFYYLAKNPRCWEQLCEEARRCSPHEPASLRYATRVFKEVLRLYPPAYVLPRVVVSPVELGGYRFEPGSFVTACVYAVHRRPELYPDPERFDPERFTPEAEASRPRGAYLPFGLGPRVCIGNHFALMEGPIILSTLARRLRFELAPGLVVQPRLQATLRPSSIAATVRLAS